MKHWILMTAGTATAMVVPVFFTRSTRPASNDHITGLLAGNTVPSTLNFEQSFYETTITVGTPPQTLSVDIDTGSSDLWVYGPNLGLESFNATRSTTYKNLNSKFQISYADSTQISGSWGSDVVGVGSVSLTDVPFAVAENSAQDDLNVGILGIGPITLEADTREYLNFPALLKEQGFISRNAYSLYLDPLTSASGVVLFGGVDTAKIAGTMAVMPITTPNYLTVEAFVLGHHLPNALLDSGTTYTYFEDSAIIKAIAEHFNATYDSELAVYTLQSLPDVSLPYVFGTGAKAVTVEVPASDVFVSIQDLLSNPPKNDNRYGLAVFEQKDMGSVLGDSFLRSAYVVFDIDANEIAVGQSRATQESLIKPIDIQISKLL